MFEYIRCKARVDLCQIMNENANMSDLAIQIGIMSKSDSASSVARFLKAAKADEALTRSPGKSAAVASTWSVSESSFNFSPRMLFASEGISKAGNFISFSVGGEIPIVCFLPSTLPPSFSPPSLSSSPPSTFSSFLVGPRSRLAG